MALEALAVVATIWRVMMKKVLGPPRCSSANNEILSVTFLYRLVSQELRIRVWVRCMFSSPARVSALKQLKRDADVGIEVLGRFASSGFMTWDAGSTLIFWRWGSPKLKGYARDGMEAFVKYPLPRKKVAARKPAPAEYKLYVNELRKIMKQAYVKTGIITGLTNNFGVPKLDNIRLVYNGSSCGLNKALWATNFWLPTPDTALNNLDFGYHSVDLDLGNMFLNFPLTEELRQESSIDLTPFKEDLRDLLAAGNKRKKVTTSNLSATEALEEEAKE
jgi:hypothetical protein